MIIYPAIDLKDGKCVRLERGLINKMTVYSNNPIEQAKNFEEQGCEWLHVIDLDGAFQGKTINTAIITAIKKNTKLKVQLGGGIRDLETIEYFFNAGIDRIILGTIALQDFKFVEKICNLYPNKIAVAMDAKNGIIYTHGWVKKSEYKVIDLAKTFEDKGVSRIIYTDINRDGVLTGIDFEGTKKLANSVSIPIIASGGVSSIKDLQNIKKIANIDGLITGKALYENKIKLSEALVI